MSQEAVPLAETSKRGPRLRASSHKLMEELHCAESVAIPVENRRSNPKPSPSRKRRPASAPRPRGLNSARVKPSEALGDSNYKNFGSDDEKSGESAAPHYESKASARFLKFGSDTLGDEDLLEHILTRGPAGFDVKFLAKGLIAEFGSFAEVVAARPSRLRKFTGLNAKSILEIKMIEAAARRMAKTTIEKRPALGNLNDVINYCRTAMAFLDQEEFRVFFLDKKNMLISDEVHGTGTIDQAAVYPREIIRRALELSASAIILAHNHPSGDPEPSTDDIYLTHQIIAAAKLISLEVHDHLIIGRYGHISLKMMQMI